MDTACRADDAAVTGDGDWHTPSRRRAIETGRDGGGAGCGFGSAGAHRRNSSNSKQNLDHNIPQLAKYHNTDFCWLRLSAALVLSIEHAVWLHHFLHLRCDCGGESLADLLAVLAIRLYRGFAVHRD